MDKLTAYQILGLHNDASTEEVKEAYARLSKEYHPEENPEEFQQIHEAYVTLTRGTRRANRTMVVESSPIEKKTVPEVKESDLVFNNVQKDEEIVEEKDKSELSFGRSIKESEKELGVEEEEQTQLDFDSSIEQAQKNEEEQFLSDIQKCIGELDVLFDLPNCNEVKKFKAFFERKEYKKVYYTQPFIHELAEHISKIDLRYSVYSYLIKFYQLKNRKVEDLIPEAQRLYRVIDRHYSVKADAIGSAKSSLILGGIGGLAYPVFKWGPRILKQFVKNGIHFQPEIIGVLASAVIVVFASILLYKFFCKKNYVYAAMRKTCGTIFILAAFFYIFEVWIPIIPMVSMAISAPLWVVSVFALNYAKSRRKENVDMR